MSIKLREKQLKNGQISFYLDIYHNKKRWYEFLEIHIQKSKPSPDDKDKKRLALEIRSKREHELIVEDNGLINKTKKNGCFIEFFEQYVLEKSKSQGKSVLGNLRKFAGKKPVPFSRLNEQWIKEFTDFLFLRCCNNTVARYISNVSDGIEYAVRKKIINTNFLKEMPESEKLKKQDVFRTAFTIEELQHLSNTPCDIDTQIKQGYMFAAFTGLRWSDVNPLRWDEISIRNIDGEERYFMHLEQEKTTGIVYLPVSDNAVDILKTRQREVLTEEKSVYVFPRLKETSNYDKIYQRMRAGLKKWSKAAGIPEGKLHFHSSRHSFATNVLESSIDGDIYTVSKLLGHKSITATQIYAHVRDNRKLAAVMALPKVSFDKLNDGMQLKKSSLDQT